MPTKNEVLIYNLPDGTSNVEVYLSKEDMWLNKEGVYEVRPKSWTCF